jgi:membrane protein implicated in regulation of membrane protease activity
VIVSKRLIIALVVGIALAILADLVLKATATSEAKLWGGELVGYWAAFGFVWYLIIVVFSKLLGRYWLERREDYYEGEDDARDE